MTLLEALRAVVHGRKERWNPAEDDTLRYLREQRREALLIARELRREQPNPSQSLLRARNWHNGNHDALA